MKKLRFFDSLKFVRFVVAVVATTFILNVAHADTNAIQSVIAYGKTEQSATPTPTAPVPIMTNNGVLKASANLLNPATVPDENKYVARDGSAMAPSSNGTFRHSDFIPVQGGETYYFGITPFAASAAGLAWYSSETGGRVGGMSGTELGQANMLATAPAGAKYMRFSWRIDNGYDTNWRNSVYVCKQGAMSSFHAFGEMYADGTVETIRDSAGHTATAQMLLGLNDEYRDEQNINTGAITRKVGVKVLDGSESWDRYNWSAGNVRDVMRVTLSSIAPDAKNVGVSLCSHFVKGNVGQFNGNTSAYAWASTYFDSTPRVAFRVAGITTVEQFKSWLAEQYANGTPVIIVYPLETETTESVATQQMTTAPVRQTAGSILGMPIEVVFGDGTREWVSEIITIATTRYNEEQFEPVQNRLSDAMDAVDDVVSRTMTQAQQIDQIANEKQTRPDEGCTAKYCLLVEDEDGTPHWYPIAGANGVEYVLPSGYTQLTYIQSDGRQMINTGYVLQETDSVEVDYELTDLTRTGDKFILGAQPVTGASNGGFWVETYNGTNDWYVRYGSGTSANTYGSVTPTSQLSGTLAISKNSFVVNGVEILNPNFVSMPVNPMTIFNRISLDGSIANFGASAQISEVRVKNGNNLVRRYIAVRNSSNELGMYDTVRGQFFTNAGTGDFTAGPDM